MDDEPHGYDTLSYIKQGMGGYNIAYGWFREMDPPRMPNPRHIWKDRDYVQERYRDYTIRVG